jgi:hypothetical protein
MTKIASLPLLLLSLLAAGCSASGGGAVAPAANTDPSAQPSAAPASGEALSPREKNARKYVEAIREGAADAEHSGRLATNGLSEEQFGLPAKLRRGMEAVTDASVDPSQATTILMLSLIETKEASESLTKRCGEPFEKFAEGLKKLSPPDRTKKVVAACKVEGRGSDKDLVVLNFAAVLTSVAVEELLKSGGSKSEAELEMARLIANFQRSDSH